MRRRRADHGPLNQGKPGHVHIHAAAVGGRTYGRGVYTIDFVEFPSNAASASGQFFTKAFGWTTTPHGPDYADVASAAVTLGVQADPDEQPSAPLVTIRTDDLDQARRDVANAVHS